MRNKVVNDNVIRRMDFVKKKVDNLVTFEQILSDHRGYRAETYGKVRCNRDFLFE